MKKLFTILLILIAAVTQAQTKTVINPPTGNKNTITHFADGLFSDSIFLIRPFCGVPNINMHPYRAAQRWGAIGLDTCNHVWYGYDPSLDAWAVFNANPNLAKLTFNYGFLCTQGTYDPNGLDMACTIDTATINQYITQVISNDTTIFQIDSAQITYFADSIVLAPPPGAISGNIWLIGSPATGLFTGKEKQIATFNGATYTYQIPNSGDIIAITNPLTAFYKFSATYPTGVWVFLRRVPSIGGDALGVVEDLGNLSQRALSLLTNGRRRFTITSGGKIRVMDFQHKDTSNNFLYVSDSTTGEIGVKAFRELVAGTGITITSSLTKDTISSTGGTNTDNWDSVLIRQGSNVMTGSRTVDFGFHDFVINNGSHIYLNAVDNGTGSGAGLRANIDGGGGAVSQMYSATISTTTGSNVTVSGDSVAIVSDNFAAPFHRETLSIQPDYIRFDHDITGGAYNPLNTKIIYMHPDTMLTTPDFMYVSDNDTIKKYPFSGGGGSSLFPLAGGTNTLTNPAIGELDGNEFDITQNSSNMLHLVPVVANGEAASISASGGSLSGIAAMAFNSNDDDGYNFNLIASNGTNSVSLVGDGALNSITATADSIYLNSTLSGAIAGNVWTLADPTTGSGYWAAGGGGGGWGTTGTVATLTGASTLAMATNTFTFDNGQVAISSSTAPGIKVTNPTSSSFAELRLINDAAQVAEIFKLGSAYPGYKILAADDLGFYNSAGGFSFQTENGDIKFAASASSPQVNIATTGVVTMSHYGAGAATFDASGNISSVSDERVKNILGYSYVGLNAIMKLHPIDFKYNGLSGNEIFHTYTGFSAQNVKDNIPNGTGETADGYLTLQDRAVMAAMVVAIQEQQKEIEELRTEIKRLKKK